MLCKVCHQHVQPSSAEQGNITCDKGYINTIKYRLCISLFIYVSIVYSTLGAQSDSLQRNSDEKCMSHEYSHTKATTKFEIQFSYA